MINKNIYQLEKYCKDYKNIENYEDALKSPLKYDLHHRRELSENKSRKDLITQHLYFDRPPEELIFLEQKEHARLHNTGKHLSVDTRQKISEAMKGKPGSCLGKHWHLSEESKKRISKSHKGKYHSEETKQKISNAMKGKHFSEEHKKSLSDSHKGHEGYWKGKRWHLENGKHIYTD